MPLPAAPIVPAEPPAPGSKGILDCPTVDYPGATTTRLALSQPYQSVCARCHGAAGEGLGAYPALPGKLSRDEFITKIRKGTENMPAFGRDFVDDAALTRDFEFLTARANGDVTRVGHPALLWSPAEVQVKRTAGLALWRKPDKEEAACANCHAPDAVDLALIGYPDQTIMRRALTHLEPKDALGIVDFIHAQRRHFKIERPCSTDWRVFQPGGEVLAGTTAKEQDASFWKEIGDRGVLLATRPLISAEDMQAGWDQLVKLDFRRLKTGIALPRWTEDRFGGEEHRTINDWIPAIARLPKDPAWYAKTDAYLADPSDAKLADLLNSVSTMTVPGLYPEGKYNLRSLFSMKYKSVLIGTHHMRKALFGQPSWYDMPDPPFVLKAILDNPFREVGATFQENFCYNDLACPEGQRQSLPAFAKAEFNPGEDFFLQANRALTHPWWMLSMLFDPGLTAGQPRFFGYSTMNYWFNFSAPGNKAPNFPQTEIHRPFLSTLLFVKRAAFFEKNRALLPPASVSPVVNADIAIMCGTGSGMGMNLGAPAGVAHNRLVSNAYRVVLHRMRRELQANSPIYIRSEMVGDNPHKGGLVPATGMWRGEVSALLKAISADPKLPASRPDVMAEVPLYNETLKLVEEVQALLQSAPEERR